MPFKSKRQQKWAFANKKSFAKKWAHATGEGGSKKHPKGSKASKSAYAKLPNKVKKKR